MTALVPSIPEAAAPRLDGTADASATGSFSTTSVHSRAAVAAGMTYQQVADESGYKNRGTVHRIVQAALQAEQSASVQAPRRLEASPLDALQATLWDRAMAGDIEYAPAERRGRRVSAADSSRPASGC